MKAARINFETTPEEHTEIKLTAAQMRLTVKDYLLSLHRAHVQGKESDTPKETPSKR